MKKTYFGLNINVGNPKTVPAFPCPVKFGSYRFWDDNTCRPTVNPSPGVYDFTQIEWWIKQLASVGVTDGLYVLAGDNGAPVPPGLNADGTGNNLDWRKWVVAISTFFNRSGFHISGYELCNEFNMPGRWQGNPVQLLRCAEDARCIIGGRGRVTATKESWQDVLKTVDRAQPTDPTALMLSPSPGWPVQPWLDYFKQPGAWEATECVSYHAYAATPATTLARLKELNASLPSPARPVWMTETSWEIPLTATLTDQDKAAWVSDIYAQASAFVERVYWYAANNQGTGLLYTDAGLTPAGRMYNMLCSKPAADSEVTA